MAGAAAPANGRTCTGGKSAITRAGLCLAGAGRADRFGRVRLLWAERTPAGEKPAIDETKWLDRLRQLQPIRSCPIVRAEAGTLPEPRRQGLVGPARPVDNPNASGPASKQAALVCYRHTGLINDGQNTCGSPWSVPAISA